jgi:hypothetical protein
VLVFIQTECFLSPSTAVLMFVALHCSLWCSNSPFKQNQELLNDDLYLGLKQSRVRGEKYDKFVDAFISAARKHYPKAYIHFVSRDHIQSPIVY